MLITRNSWLVKLVGSQNMKAKMNLFVKTKLEEWDHPTKNILNVSNVISEANF